MGDIRQCRQARSSRLDFCGGIVDLRSWRLADVAQRRTEFGQTDARGKAAGQVWKRKWEVRERTIILCEIILAGGLDLCGACIATGLLEQEVEVVACLFRQFLLAVVVVIDGGSCKMAGG